VAEHRVKKTESPSVPVWTVWWRHWYAENLQRSQLYRLLVPSAVAGRRWVVSARCRADGVHTVRYTTPAQTPQVGNSGVWCGNYKQNSMSFTSWAHKDYTAPRVMFMSNVTSLGKYMNIVLLYQCLLPYVALDLRLFTLRPLNTTP
jgi:hypothetical protein